MDCISVDVSDRPFIELILARAVEMALAVLPLMLEPDAP
jgi:hypothetical protein